jgi:uncharacterized protein
MATNRNNNDNTERKGEMTVREAGELGGERTSETHGREFYEEIGHKGGQRVRELINEGKEAEGGSQGNRSNRSDDGNR